MSRLEKAFQLLEEVLKDRGVPRNVKNVIEEAINTVKNETESDSVKISTIISMLDEVSNDPNLSLYARTKVWNVVSKLEELCK
ncbi:MAG: UPF0147 family protein [Candidatus Aenigmatarchaeota archaeon]